MNTPAPSPAYSAPDRSQTWVQPIIVAKTGTHEDTVWLAARASVAVYLGDPDATVLGEPLTGEEKTRLAYRYHQWLSGPFTKTVRRATEDKMLDVAIWARLHRIPMARLADGHGCVALALPPMRYADLPRQISRLQVAGTDLPRVGSAWNAHRGGVEHGQAWPPVDLYVDEQLTTGKAAAQAAHALWMWMLDVERTGTPIRPNPVLQAWAEEGYPVALCMCEATELARGLDLIEHQPRGENGSQRAFPVRDAGLTEVAPNTLTAMAVADSRPTKNIRDSEER